jgi:two-component system response regulator GlrR
VRIILATHKNLQQTIIDKTFREDLYCRLNVVESELPYLSECREDILLLTQYFLNQSADQSHINITGFSQEAMEVLISATWSGNIRQLQNVVEQTLTLSTAPLISEMLVKNTLRHDKPWLVVMLSS